MFETLSLVTLSISAAFMIFLWRLNKAGQQETKDAQKSAAETPDQ